MKSSVLSTALVVLICYIICEIGLFAKHCCACRLVLFSFLIMSEEGGEREIKSYATVTEKTLL